MVEQGRQSMKVEVPPESKKRTRAVSPASPAPRRRRRWLRRLLVLSLLLGGLGFFLPAIVASLLPNKQATAWLSQRLPAQFEVNSAELAWQSPVKLGGITVTLAEGDSVATVENVSTQQSLWDVVTGGSQPVALNLEGFRLSLTVPDSFQSDAPADLAKIVRALHLVRIPRPAYPTIIQVTRGAIELRDSEHKLLAVWEPVDLKYEFQTADGPAHAVSLKLPGEVGGPDMLSLTANLKQVGASPVQEELTFELSGQGISLQNLQPLAAKALGPNVVLGEIQTRSSGVFRRDAQAGWALKLAGEVRNSEVPQTSSSPVRQVAWQLPIGDKAEVELEATYDKPANQLLLPQFKLSAAETGANLRGQITELSNAGLVEMTGDIRVPGLQALDILPASLRERIHVEGLSLTNLAYRGALKPPAGQAIPQAAMSVDVGWQRIQAYGLDLAPGTIRYSLAGNVLHGEPKNVSLNGGTLHALPDVILDPVAPVLVFREGLMLEKVQLTEEVCRDWLRYISPTMANATATEGAFSVTTHAGRVPLLQLEQGDLPGVLRIHQARVRPGPLAMEILGIVNQVQQLVQRGAGNDLTNQTWMQLADEDVRFRLLNGRVYHEAFRFQIGDVPAATTGSVGLDNTLDLKLVVALPEKWTANGGPVLQALRGEVIEVPVRGTMDRPQLDGKGLADFGKRMGVRAGIGILERILENRGR